MRACACKKGAKSPFGIAVGAGWLLVVVACATSYVSGQGSTWENSPRRARPEDASIDVVERSEIVRPYKPIGIVQAAAPSWEKGPGDDQMLAALKLEARKLGGDAITDLVKNPGSKPVWWGPLPFYASRLDEVRWAGLVIVWLD